MRALNPSRRALLGAAGAVPFLALAISPAMAASAQGPLAAEWREFIHPWMSADLQEVALDAAEQGLRVEHISCVSLHRNDRPELAPAIHFEQPNGDQVIVNRFGTQRVLARQRRSVI